MPVLAHLRVRPGPHPRRGKPNPHRPNSGQNRRIPQWRATRRWLLWPVRAEERSDTMLSLMLTRRFAPLFWTQFFSAFSDNFLKNALVFLLLYEIKGPNSEMLITLTAPVFIAPFFFLSALGGE